MKPTSKGFTLIEVLLGMTLLGIMMTLLMTTIVTCVRSWDAGEKKITQVSEAGAVYRFFSRYLANARPLWDDVAEQEPRVFSFQGQTQSLAFVSTFPASATRSGLQRFSIDWTREADDSVLKVTITPFVFSDGSVDEFEEIVLLRQVNDFRIDYFGQDAVSGVEAWQEQWLQKESLPRLVKISIVQGESIWPEMTIAFKLFAAEPVQQDRGFD